MDRLSVELVEAIAGHLDAADALALAATSRALHAGCRTRLDPAAYLQTTFRNPRSLLAAMTDHGCILSGSRALDFFVPGSAGPASDWDFLVPCVRDSTHGMMAALAAAGVHWPHPLQPLFDLAAQPPGAVVYVPVAAIRHLSAQRLAHNGGSPVTPRLLAVYRQLRAAAYDTDTASDYFALHVGGAGPAGELVPRIAIVPWTAVRSANRPTGSGDSSDPPPLHGYDGSAGPAWPVHVLNGTVGGHGAAAACKVQLFQCHASFGTACSPLQYVFDTYYATHVQCFVAGWGAAHAFFGLARQCLALLWPAGQTDAVVVAAPAPLPATTNTNRARGVAKYRRRGFRVFDAAARLDEVGDDLAPLPLVPDGAPRLSAAQLHALLDAARALMAPASASAAAAEAPARLGQPGTLLLRFGALEDQVCAAAAAVDNDTDTADAARALYRALGRSLVAFRFAFPAGRPAAREPPAPPDLPRRTPPSRRWQFAADNDTDIIAADDDAALAAALPPLAVVLARGAPPAAPGIARTPPPSPPETDAQARRHDVLLSATPGACSNWSCDMHLACRPPQI